MCIIPKAANDMMNVGRLQGFEVRIHTAAILLQCNCLDVLKCKKLYRLCIMSVAAYV